LVIKTVGAEEEKYQAKVFIDSSEEENSLSFQLTLFLTKKNNVDVKLAVGGGKSFSMSLNKLLVAMGYKGEGEEDKEFRILEPRSVDPQDEGSDNSEDSKKA